nr:hypothetical protein DA06_11790 [Georgenia sp. SUBG003]
MRQACRASARKTLPDPRDDPLVEQRGADRSPELRDAPSGLRRVGVAAQRVRAQAGHEGVPPGGAEDLARARGDEVPRHAVGSQPQAHLPHRLPGDGREPQPLAAHPEMDVHGAAARGVDEEMLPDGVDVHDRVPVHLLRGEPALRGCRADAGADELGHVPGEPVDRVSLGHQRSFRRLPLHRSHRSPERDGSAEFDVSRRTRRLTEDLTSHGGVDVSLDGRRCGSIRHALAGASGGPRRRRARLGAAPYRDKTWSSTARSVMRS